MSRLLLLAVSFLTFVIAARADDDSSGTLCDFTTVIGVANEYYSGCRDLYNILEQSVPVNYTSLLCDDADCMSAINKLRSMDLGDCIVFGDTTLTSDILDQCKDSGSVGWVGYVILFLTLAVFIPVVVYRVKFWRTKRAAAQLDLANGKMGINDGPYKEIDLAGARV